MELENTGMDEMELGFMPVPDGTYIYQLMEGVELIVKEDSESKTLKIPLLVDSVVDGDADAVGMPSNKYVNIVKKDGEENPFGGKTINNILTMVDLIDSFVKNFDGEIAADDEKFVNALKLKLPGKFLRLTHNVVKDDEGRSNINWTKIAKVKKKGGTGAGVKKGSTKKEPATESAEDEWQD